VGFLCADVIAAKMGADGIELDIQLTKDGEIVVIHDETIDRTSSHSGKVNDYTLAQLKKINFNKRGITPPKFMEIPTLHEVFELIKPLGLTINIELKTNVNRYNGIEKKALKLASQFGLLEKIVWSSFNHYSVQAVKLSDPQARTALLCSGGIIITAEQCEKTNAEALHCHINQLKKFPELAEDCQKREILLRPWVVDTEDDFQLAAQHKADAVFTNDISATQQFLKGS
jgi:glycerophosphoryl diester phosphodiesterase